MKRIVAAFCAILVGCAFAEGVAEGVAEGASDGASGGEASMRNTNGAFFLEPFSGDARKEDPSPESTQAFQDKRLDQKNASKDDVYAKAQFPGQAARDSLQAVKSESINRDGVFSVAGHRGSAQREKTGEINERDAMREYIMSWLSSPLVKIPPDTYELQKTGPFADSGNRTSRSEAGILAVDDGLAPFREKRDEGFRGLRNRDGGIALYNLVPADEARAAKRSSVVE